MDRHGSSPERIGGRRPGHCALDSTLRSRRGAARRSRCRRAVAAVALLSGLAVAIAAPARDAAAQQLRVGSAIVTPALDVSGAFDTNVFAAPRSERSDWFVSIVPSLDIESDWAVHAFSFRAQGEFRQYLTYTSENQANASIAGTGRIDLATNAYVLAGAGYQRLHEDRGALVPVSGIKPTRFTVASGKTAFVIEPAPLGLRLDATADSLSYANVTLSSGALVNQSARNRTVYALYPRISYRMLPHHDAFLGAAVNRRQYHRGRLADGLDRRSTGYGVAIGSAFDMPGFAAGEVYLGYLTQEYDAAAVRPIRAVDFGGNMEWRPFESTALRFNLARSIEESAVLGSPGYLQTAVRLAVEHETIPRLLLLGTVGYSNADFARSGGNSDLYEARLGARYRLAGNLSVGLAYTVGHRASSGALPDYTRQIIELSLRCRL